ncbi:DUF4268 domain-containing protein [Deinococcus sp.]|uniref:DUF4268 domain-containing protein n=1 Tax=Deinococcus sp. TaxID=47478 RepID=UPI0025C6D0F1|nr:DUF4268 domain-containing protein [Deinococcus sp.]
MKSYQLSALQRVSIQDVWPKEAQDFTPWLSGHLPLLSDVLGIELQLVATEHPVGPFRADLLCTAGSEEALVVIENQFYKTDHSHLGQLLTYAAGTKASTLVWIAETFTAEHRAALDWLNTNTPVGVNFFGLELELWRIGDSLPAPKFNVISQPNNWTKLGVSGVQEITPTAQLQLAFWTAFREYVLERTTALKPGQPQPLNWYEFYIGKYGFWIGARVNTKLNSLWVALFMQPPATKAMFQQLEAQKADIEAHFGCAMIWKENPDLNKSNIELHRLNSDLRDQERWPEYFDWLLSQLLKLKQVFVPLLPSLSDEVGTLPTYEENP